MDNIIYWINHYPLDSWLDFFSTNIMDIRDKSRIPDCDPTDDGKWYTREIELSKRWATWTRSLLRFPLWNKCSNCMRPENVVWCSLMCSHQTYTSRLSGENRELILHPCLWYTETKLTFWGHGTFNIGFINSCYFATSYPGGDVVLLTTLCQKSRIIYLKDTSNLILIW